MAPTGQEDDSNRRKLSVLEDKLAKLFASSATFQKMSYVLFVGVVALAAWYGSSLQGLQEGRTRNADRLESLNKEVTDFKAYMETRRVANELANDRQNGRMQQIETELREIDGKNADLIAKMSVELSKLAFQFDTHTRNDDERYQRLHPEARPGNQ